LGVPVILVTTPKGSKVSPSGRGLPPPDLERYKQKNITVRRLPTDAVPPLPKPAKGGMRDDDPAMIAHSVHAMHLLLIETRDAIRDSFVPKLVEISDRLGIVEDHQSANQLIVHQQLGGIDRRLDGLDGSFVALNARLDMLDKRQLATELELHGRVGTIEHNQRDILQRLVVLENAVAIQKPD
jgi:hypothetical protein